MNTTSKKVINTITQEIFGSVAEAERKNGIKKGILIAKLNGRATNNTSFKYFQDVYS